MRKFFLALVFLCSNAAFCYLGTRLALPPRVTPASSSDATEYRGPATERSVPGSCPAVNLQIAEAQANHIAQVVLERLRKDKDETNRNAVTEESSIPQEPRPEQRFALENATRLVDSILGSRKMTLEQRDELRQLLTAANQPEQAHDLRRRLMIALNRREFELSFDYRGGPVP